MELKEKAILITGANSGIGKATPELLTEAGMMRLLTARNKEKLEHLAKSLPRAEMVAGDMTDPVLPQMLVDTALEKFGRLDAVFNNAGVMNIGSIEEADLEALCSMIRLNFESVVRMSYVALRYMKTKGSDCACRLLTLKSNFYSLSNEIPMVLLSITAVVRVGTILKTFKLVSCLNYIKLFFF